MLRIEIPSVHSTALAVLLAALGALSQAGCADVEDVDEDPATVALALSGRSNPCQGPGGVAQLACAGTPFPSGTDIVDRSAAIRLGKALFWDAQVGGDGQVACASCHFHAGTDARTFNTVNPGPNGIFQIGGVTAAGQTLSPGPFAADDRIGSQGVAAQVFVSISTNPSRAADVCTPAPAPPFGSSRQVTARNAPTVIGAAYNRDNFWDGRANHTFNGLDPFGSPLNVPLADGIEDASLASQAVGPSNNGVEMSCAGRTFNGVNSLGAKLVPRAALHFQSVAPGDSVLGYLSAAPGLGLWCEDHACTYQELIAAAFTPDLAAHAVDRFSRIFGEALLAYESTLLPDQTPLDRYLGGDQTALTSTQRAGLGLFASGKGNCANCHAGPALSDASSFIFQTRGALNEDGGDQGFHNIGVRPTAEDIGRAGTGPLGTSFSESGAAADRGAFKTPSLRNVKLTAPYFHNGDKATLLQVVEFYSRGGDFANPERAKRIKQLNLDPGEKASLVDFLTNGLTDCRVEKEAAPFDHPSLVVPNGPSLAAVGASGLGPCP